jgi:hypothetical protein
MDREWSNKIAGQKVEYRAVRSIAPLYILKMLAFGATHLTAKGKSA